jgi:hypothetical protein
VAVLCLFTALVVLFGARLHGRRGARWPRHRLVKAGAVGLLAQVLFLPLLSSRASSS